MAPPCKLTPDVHATICGLLRAGNYVETAAASAGVGAWSVRHWMRKGRDALQREAEGEELAADDERFARFAEDVEKAQAVGESRLVAAIAKQASEDHRAAQFLLERKYPKRWGQKINVTVTEELNAFLDRLEKKLDAATFERVLEAAVEHTTSRSGDPSEAAEETTH